MNRLLYMVVHTPLSTSSFYQPNPHFVYVNMFLISPVVIILDLCQPHHIFFFVNMFLLLPTSSFYQPQPHYAFYFWTSRRGTGSQLVTMETPVFTCCGTTISFHLHLHLMVPSHHIHPRQLSNPLRFMVKINRVLRATWTSLFGY